MKKLGPNAYPFTFNFPPNAPSSVTLQSGNEDTDKPLGVMYTVKAYVAGNQEQESHKRSSVALTVKKV
jgi:arrestin-2